MDPDGKRLNDLEIDILKQRGNILLNDSDVLQPTWLRRLIQDGNELDRFLLDYGFNFLWNCGILSWIVFFLQKSL